MLDGLMQGDDRDLVKIWQKMNTPCFDDIGGAGAVSPAVVVLAWLAVGIPLAWGVYRTVQSVAKFFN